MRLGARLANVRHLACSNFASFHVRDLADRGGANGTADCENGGAENSYERVYSHTKVQEATDFAIKCPYLMHAVLAGTVKHLNRLSPGHKEHSIAETHHWQQALTLFQKELNSPLGLHNMDAVLSTCMVLAIMSFSAEEFNPSKSWVFSPEPSAMNWLSIQSGLKSILIETKPYLHHSIWIPVFEESDDEEGTYADERPGTVGLPNEWVDLCEIDARSTVENNPYHAPVRLLAPLLNIEPGIHTFSKLVPFMGRIRLEFFQLLQSKDPRALLIISYWFGMMCSVEQWWILDRVRSEGIAICMFLEGHPDPRIRALLECPARACGYSSTSFADKKGFVEEVEFMGLL